VSGKRQYVRIAIITVSVDVCFRVYDDAILRTMYQNLETVTRCGLSVNAPLGLPVVISSDQTHNGKCAYTLYGRPQPLTNKVGRELLSDINTHPGHFKELSHLSKSARVRAGVTSRRWYSAAACPAVNLST
jgi:hypothetical protein